MPSCYSQKILLPQRFLPQMNKKEGKYNIVDSEMFARIRCLANSKFSLILKTDIYCYFIQSYTRLQIQELANNSEMKILLNKDHTKISESTVFKSICFWSFQQGQTFFNIRLFNIFFPKSCSLVLSQSTWEASGLIFFFRDFGL